MRRAASTRILIECRASPGRSFWETGKRAVPEDRGPAEAGGGAKVAAFAVLDELPLRDVTPEGWLRRVLELQRHGLTGHLDTVGDPFRSRGWASNHLRISSPDPCFKPWWPYEQIAYWIDGMVRCAHLLDDADLLAKAREQIDAVLAHPASDGYLGPALLRDNRWAHAVFCRALMAEYSATWKSEIVDAVRRHYLLETQAHHRRRGVCNIEGMCWAYGLTGDRRLLRIALDAFRAYDEHHRGDAISFSALREMVPARIHGVTYNEIAKLPAILYLHTGRRPLLGISRAAFDRIDRFHLLVDGVCSSTEVLLDTRPFRSHETCDIADHTWSLGYMLMATGEARWADKIERACFNAAPGAIRTYDFRALQYFSCPNQLVCTLHSDHNPTSDYGSARMSYRPQPHVAECCAGNVNRIFPNYAARMWMRAGKTGVAAALYGPSELEAAVGPEGKVVRILEETAYPFSEEIEFQIRTREPVRFSFWLRIPGWCTDPAVSVRGRALERKLEPGTFVAIRRVFRHNDRISVRLPMNTTLSRWPDGGAAVERGPLVFSLGVAEDWRVDGRGKRSTRYMPAYDLYPAGRWNYALDMDETDVQRLARLEHRPMTDNPWTLATAPLRLYVPARRVRDWRLVRKKRVKDGYSWSNAGTYARDFVFTPRLPDAQSLAGRLGKSVETITLVPYGCTHLRLTVFPDARGTVEKDRDMPRRTASVSRGARSV